ncbi:MAG: hemolysin III family protein [Acidimicrobiia bacterium]
MERFTLGKMQNPIRGFLHGGAAVATIVGLGFLLSRAWGSAPAIAGALIFGIALLVMYTISSLYHSIPWGDSWKARLQRVDHSMIYLVVAGTFTPIAIAALDGGSLVVALSLVWTIALAGILIKAFLPNVKTYLSVTLQMLMGWLAVAFVPQIYGNLGLGATVLIFLGGLCYSVGVIIFVTKRPQLFPRTFSYHELFHVLVIAGSTFHFIAILAYAIPATV